MRRALAALLFASPVFAQTGTPYEGPAVLTRGEAPAALTAAQVDFRPFVDVTGVYDTGLTGLIVNDKGQLASEAAAGIELSYGVSGVHSWRHTRIGLDYRGAFRHYDRQTFYDGTDQSLLLGITQQLSRHTTLTLREAAGLFSRDYGFFGLPQTVPFDVSTSYIPATDFFDNRTIYASTQADLTIQKSARLSFDFGGDGFLARRRSTALYGVTGATARGDLQYRLTRRTTIGAAYTYTHFTFTRVFSGTDLHTAVGSYSVRLSRSLEFTGYAGIMRAETKFVQSVPLDPVVAALLGVAQGNVVVHRIDHLPTYSARLSRAVHDGVLYLSGGYTITPGNGLFLTSKVSTVQAGYSYTGLRHWSFTSGLSTDFATSVGNINGKYRDYGANLGASRQITGALHAIAALYLRRYDSPSFSGYNRPVYGVRLGFGFSPGDIPLRIW